MKNLASIIAVSAIILLVILVPESVMAQPPSFPENPPQVPIDGGLGILAAAGGAYALNKLRKRKE